MSVLRDFLVTSDFLCDAQGRICTVSGSGYLIAPEPNAGPGLLVLSSWWGLGDAQRAICDDLAALGYVVLCPDLVGDGRTTTEVAIAQYWLAERDMNEVADLVLSSATLLRDSTVTPNAPIGVLGLQMGASWALWLASRAPELVGAVSFFYGTQQVDHLEIRCPVQGHFAEYDELVADDDKVLLSAALHLGGAEVECFDYPGTSAGFFEAGTTYDPDAARLARDRMGAWFDRFVSR